MKTCCDGNLAPRRVITAARRLEPLEGTDSWIVSLVLVTVNGGIAHNLKSRQLHEKCEESYGGCFLTVFGAVMAWCESGVLSALPVPLVARNRKRQTPLLKNDFDEP